MHESQRVISIHALHEESDAVDRDVGRPCSISIHALHEESDVLCNPHAAMLTHISIHALHDGERSVSAAGQDASTYFNPRSP